MRGPSARLAMRPLFLTVLPLWLLRAVAEAFEVTRDGYLKISTDVMWKNFLEGYVDSRCFRLCWERWLPMDIDFTDPGYYIVYQNVDRDWHDILDRPSEQYCGRLSYARAFQRCYISYCGGLFARVPNPPMGNHEGDKPKLWAWTSEYVARYGPGEASFEDYNFLPEENTFWGPFPLGLTAACFKAPDQVFSSNLTDLNLIKTKAINSTDGRFPLPQAIRKLLIPIWTSPNLLDYWSYSLQVEHVDDQIEEPRPLTDLHKKIITTYIAAIFAYAHLLSISSNSKRRFPEAVQLLAFCLIPLLPAIQLLHNFIDAMIFLSDGEPGENYYLLAGIAGVVIYEKPTYRARLLEVDVSHLAPSSLSRMDFQWLGRLIGIAINLGALMFTIIPYFSRLTYRFHGATFCAATGFDHRVGWIATSALVPIFTTLVLHLINKDWVLQEGTERNQNTEDWKSRLALEWTAATVVLEILIMLTGRVTVTEVIFDRLLRGKLQFVLVAVMTAALVLASAWRPLSLLYSNPSKPFHKSLIWLLVVISAAYSFLVFLLQIFLDMEEYADLALDFVLPWNYRWQIPRPAWSEWL